MIKVYAVTASVCVVAMLGGLGAMVWLKSDDGCAPATKVAGGASIGGPFELVDQTGATVTDKQVITKPSLVYFGYTYCPDVCPLDVARNVAAVDILKDSGKDVQPVFISIDPQRDTPEALADFAYNIYPDMVALTGTDEQVKAASLAYRTYYKRQPGGGDDYLLDHSTFTYLVTPENGFVEFFRRDTTPEDMATRVACHAKNG